jgi:hypothetical protein
MGCRVKQNNGFVNVTRSADTLFGANATNPGSPNTVTTSMWVTVAGHDQSWQTLLSHGEGNQYRIATRDTSTNASYAGGVGDIPTANGIGPDLAGGAWHHVLAISEGGVSTRLWVDGGLVATGGVPVIDDARGGGLPESCNRRQPGHRCPEPRMVGKIDEVAQWNRALSDAEIGQIWGGGPGTARSIAAQIIPEPAPVSSPCSGSSAAPADSSPSPLTDLHGRIVRILRGGRGSRAFSFTTTIGSCTNQPDACDRSHRRHYL